MVPSRPFRRCAVLLLLPLSSWKAIFLLLPPLLRARLSFSFFSFDVFSHQCYTRVAQEHVTLLACAPSSETFSFSLYCFLIGLLLFLLRLSLLLHILLTYFSHLRSSRGATARYRSLLSAVGSVVRSNLLGTPPAYA